MKTLVLAVLLAPLLPAADVINLKWNELSSAVVDRPATVILASDVQLQGRITGVDADALQMLIEKAPRGSAYSRGQSSIPGRDVREIRLRSVKGYGRLIGAAGAGAGVALGTLNWAISDSRINVSDGARIAQWAGITAGAVVGGYLIGRLADRRETHIRVVREGAGSTGPAPAETTGNQSSTGRRRSDTPPQSH